MYLYATQLSFDASHHAMCNTVERYAVLFNSSQTKVICYLLKLFWPHLPFGMYFLETRLMFLKTRLITLFHYTGFFLSSGVGRIQLKVYESNPCASLLPMLSVAEFPILHFIFLFPFAFHSRVNN